MLKNKVDNDAIKEIDDKFESGAKLKSNIKAGRPKKKHANVEKIMNVYNVPHAWIDAIKERQIPFSIYAKLAIEAKLKADGWI